MPKDVVSYIDGEHGRRCCVGDPHAGRDPLKGMKYYPKGGKWEYSRWDYYVSDKTNKYRTKEDT